MVEHKLFQSTIAVLLAVVLSLCAPPAVRADDGAVGKSGQGVVPLQSNDVELVAERVDLYPYQFWTFVEAEFTLRNDGPAAEVLVGFPEEQFTYESEVRGTRPLEIRDFTATVDGKAVAVTYEPAGPSPLIQGRQLVGWHTFTVPFAAGQTRTLRHTYWLRPSGSSNGAQLLSYLLQTGATWKGKIGKADIYLHPSGGYTLDDFKPRRGSSYTDPMSVHDHAAEGGVVAWHLSDFEPGPQDDINVFVEPPGTRLVAHASGTAEGSAATPGAAALLALGPIYPTARWQTGTRVVLFAGQERVRLAEGVLERPGEADLVQFAGIGTLPVGVTPAHGRAVEVWAETEFGERSLSSLVFLADSPSALPRSGEPSPGWLVLAGAGPILLGTGLRLRRRRVHAIHDEGSLEG